MKRKLLPSITFLLFAGPEIKTSTGNTILLALLLPSFLLSRLLLPFITPSKCVSVCRLHLKWVYLHLYLLHKDSARGDCLV